VTTFAEAIRRIDLAASFDELVRAPETASAAYRRWVKLVHPDAVTATQGASATHAFAKLSRLYAERAGSTPRARPGIHRIGERFASGDIADLYTVDGGLLKVPRDHADNDLMAAEADALRRLREDGDPTYHPYAPALRNSFLHEDAARVRRRVNVVEKLDGFVALSRLKRHLDPRDAAWMWRRLLVALGWAHRAGVVHGAVIEEHVLIHPAAHGLALVDWCYSGATATAIVAARRDAYPPEVTRDRTQGPATDIYMAAGLMTRLMGNLMPQAMRRFAAGCSYDPPRMRPQDAWALLGELDELLRALYGPRTFRPFTIE
jgi:hypothetical protein